MLLAGLFAAILFLALLMGDWFHFTSLTVQASSYGCQIAHAEDRLPSAPLAASLERLAGAAVLRLPNGVARVLPDERSIVFRPQYGLRSRRFRTAWPMKGTIHLEPDGELTRLICAKRIPWSSAILTLLWFLLVGIGMIAFIIAFLANGGLASLGGLLMGLGILGLGLLVLAFGLITVALAYRLEDHRLTQVYQELRSLLLTA
jgi:hypothetical protein